MKLCKIDKCKNTVQAKGYCNKHYKKWRKYGNPLFEERKTIQVTQCIVETCDNKARYNPGYCSKHGQQIKKQGNTHDGRTGGYKAPNGYMVVYRPDHPNANSRGELAEHRYVMSEYLERPLLKGENVHHKNGQRDDNRIENLELWSTNQPPGQRVSDKIRWALELLEIYGNDPTKFEE